MTTSSSFAMQTLFVCYVLASLFRGNSQMAASRSRGRCFSSKSRTTKAATVTQTASALCSSHEAVRSCFLMFQRLKTTSGQDVWIFISIVSYQLLWHVPCPDIIAMFLLLLPASLSSDVPQQKLIDHLNLYSRRCERQYPVLFMSDNLFPV